MTPAPILWFTGLPATGKTTISRALAEVLRKKGHRVQILDGDDFRKATDPNLGFTRAERDLNVQRLVYVAALLAAHGVWVLVAAVSPYREARLKARKGAPGPFVEVFVQTSMETLSGRDDRYRQARAGRIPRFTGVSDWYEEPKNPEVIVQTDRTPPNLCVATILDYLESHGLLLEKTT